MFIIDLDFQLANDSDQSQAYDAVDNVLQAMRMNGQICSKEWGITLSGTSAYVRVLVPEAQALEQRYANQWVLNALNSPSISSMTINNVGADYIDDICDCSTTASYILYTYELLMSPALHCGACFRSIPLYRIPAFNNSEYFDILYWESTYQALDALDQAMGEQLNALIRHELASVESTTAVWGLRICRQIQAQTSIPTYYYLADGNETCPGGQQPFDPTPWHRFDLACHRCKLVSNHPSS